MIVCTVCKKDIDEKGQDNMSSSKHPKCEDCIKITNTRHDGCPDDCSLYGGFCVYDDNTNSICRYPLSLKKNNK